MKLRSTRLLILGSLASAFGFSTLATLPSTKAKRNSNLSAIGSSSSGGADAAGEGSPQRRALLAFALTTAAVPLFGLQESRGSLSAKSTTASSSADDSLFAPLANLEDAVGCIEKSVDPRFLHAVVASDYQCLYQQGSQLGVTAGFLETPTTVATKGQNNDGAVFDSLELNQLKGKPVRIGQSQLLLSNLDAAHRRWGKDSKRLVAVWPLVGGGAAGTTPARKDAAATGAGVHYAWPEGGGTFAAGSSVIVDGVDCGRMSLEDALGGDMEVLVQAKRFLVVPLAMEKQLVQKLRGAFVI